MNNEGKFCDEESFSQIEPIKRKHRHSRKHLKYHHRDMEYQPQTSSPPDHNCARRQLFNDDEYKKDDEENSFDDSPPKKKNKKTLKKKQTPLPEKLVVDSYITAKLAFAKNSIISKNLLKQIELAEYVLVKLALGDDTKITNNWKEFQNIISQFEWTSKIRSVFRNYGSETDTLSEILKQNRSEKIKNGYIMDNRNFYFDINEISVNVNEFNFDSYASCSIYPDMPSLDFDLSN